MSDVDAYRRELRGWLEVNLPSWWREEVAPGSNGFVCLSGASITGVTGCGDSTECSGWAAPGRAQ